MVFDLDVGVGFFQIWILHYLLVLRWMVWILRLVFKGSDVLVFQVWILVFEFRKLDLLLVFCQIVGFFCVVFRGFGCFVFQVWILIFRMQDVGSIVGSFLDHRICYCWFFVDVGFGFFRFGFLRSWFFEDLGSFRLLIQICKTEREIGNFFD